MMIVTPLSALYMAVPSSFGLLPTSTEANRDHNAARNKLLRAILRRDTIH